MKSLSSTRLILPAVALLGLVAFQTLPAASQDAPDRAGFSHVAGFDHIQTDDVRYNLNTGDFEMKNRFTATRQGMDITADSGQGNSKKKMLHAQGHVIVHQNKKIENRGKDASTLTEQPSTLTCDKLDVDGGRKLYTAEGSVHFTQEDRDVTADRGTLDDGRNVLHLEGNVHIRDKQQYMDADVVDYNTSTGEMNAHGSVSIRTPTETPAPAGPPRPRPTRRP
jgi:lipopolysaccharide assembly outer membrane protein LptD (OstA)